MTLTQTSEIALLRQQRDAAERRAASLGRVIELLAGDLDLDPLLTRIIESVIELVGAQCGAIGIGREEPDGPIIEALTSVNFPPAERWLERQPGALAAAVLRARQPVTVDRYADLGAITIPELADFAFLGLPIWWRERLIGVFVLGAAPPRRFSDEDVATAILFARYAAIAIEQARRLAAEQRRVARGRAISRIGHLLTSRLALDQLLATAMSDIGQHFPDIDVALLLVDPAAPDHLVLHAWQGPFAVADQVSRHRQSITVGIIGEAIRRRHRLLVQDVTQDPHYIRGDETDGVRAELAVPLYTGADLLGVFNAEARAPFSPDDVEGLTMVAEQLAIAIQNAMLFDRAQRGLAETQLLYATSQRIGMAMDVDAVVTAYLEQIAARGPYVCTVVLYDFDAAGRRSGVLVWGRWSPTEGLVHQPERRRPRAPDDLDPLLDAGQTVTISDVQADPRVSAELRRIQTEVGRPALAMIPLMARGQRTGLIILSAPRVQAWPEADLHPYQITAAQLAAAIDSRRQQQVLAEQRQRLTTIEERRRLARELHDSVTQSMVSINMMAQVLPELWELDQAEARRALAEIREQTRGALTEMRALLLELHLGDETAPDLVHLLKQQIAAFERRTGLSLTIDLPAALPLPSTVVHDLGRIAQEALANIARHAQARHVCLTLEAGPPPRLVIADDGRGFQPDQIVAGRLGLVSMRERAAGIGGHLRVESSPGQGSRITVTWPTSGGEPPSSGEGETPWHRSA